MLSVVSKRLKFKWPTHYFAHYWLMTIVTVQFPRCYTVCMMILTILPCQRANAKWMLKNMASLLSVHSLASLLKLHTGLKAIDWTFNNVYTKSVWGFTKPYFLNHYIPEKKKTSKIKTNSKDLCLLQRNIHLCWNLVCGMVYLVKIL